MRERIQIITASAGSGKTWRLAEMLKNELADGRVRPEAVLATTFTNRAAAELQERARRHLLREGGRSDDAQRLAAARIGTVNSVCGRLVSDFAFELGLSPELQVIDEAGAELAFAQALSRERAVSPSVEQLDALKQRFDDSFDWLGAVRDVVKLARQNAIAPEQLPACAQRSTAELIALWLRPEEGTGPRLDRELRQALKRFLRNRPRQDTTKKTRKAVDCCRRVLERLERGLPVKWADWVRLNNLDVAKKSAAVAEGLLETAGAYDRHPQLAEDLRTAIELVFELAAQALSAYRQHKCEWGLMDFADQEEEALKLLRRDDVRERLAEELDLVLVDEFQDTSPLQLAIFVELARIAPRSVWVGDQKQSIFGFRGSDPALMDAAIKAVLEGREPETLDRSWRSRPGLVQLTSELFAPAFGLHDIPGGRVKLEPERGEPAGAGSVWEHWVLDSSNQAGDAGALAGLVAEHLADPEAAVVDRATDRARPVRPADIAVLCRTHKACAQVAAELEANAVPAMLPRTGLMATLEGQLVLAGLELVADPFNRLAAARVTRLLGAEPERWLEAVLDRDEGDRLHEDEALAALLEEARNVPLAGACRTLELVIEVLELTELCLGWGRSEQRLANLDALRAVAHAFVEEAARDGRSASPASLIAQLGRLADEGQDHQAVVAGADAVTVSTWHAAKGLEWPVVVLFGLDFGHEDTALGVTIVADDDFDFADPLAGRWIRYWPACCFHPRQRSTRLHEALDGHAARECVLRQARREALRLMYVGWTRARDRLILAARHDRLLQGGLAEVADDAGPLLEDTGAPVERLSLDAPQTLRHGLPAEGAPAERRPGEGTLAAGPREHPPARRRPSDAETEGRAAAVERLGERLPLSGSPAMGALGNAVHGFLAADRPGLAAEIRRSVARGLIERWQVSGAIETESLLRAGEALRAWVEARWPEARWHREWPVVQRLEDGSVVSGVADLVLDTGEELIVIDHKSYPGGESRVEEKAAGFAGQLSAYARAVSAATGRPCRETWIHLPVSGLAVRVEAPS